MAILRLLTILRVMVYYRLDDELRVLHVPLWLRIFLQLLPLRCLPRCNANLARGVRLRLAL